MTGWHCFQSVKFYCTSNFVDYKRIQYSRSTSEGSSVCLIPDVNTALSASKKCYQGRVFLFSFSFVIPGVFFFFVPLTSFYWDLSSFRQQIPCSFSSHLHALAITPIRKVFFFVPVCFCFAASPPKKDSKTYFPEQAGSGTCYPNPEDILCSTLGHKSQSPEDFCINEEHLDKLRVTSNITQPAENFWPTGVERWSWSWPTGKWSGGKRGSALTQPQQQRQKNLPKYLRSQLKPPQITASTLVCHPCYQEQKKLKKTRFFQRIQAEMERAKTVNGATIRSVRTLEIQRYKQKTLSTLFRCPFKIRTNSSQRWRTFRSVKNDYSQIIEVLQLKLP